MIRIIRGINTFFFFYYLFCLKNTCLCHRLKHTLKCFSNLRICHCLAHNNPAQANRQDADPCLNPGETHDWLTERQGAGPLSYWLCCDIKPHASPFKMDFRNRLQIFFFFFADYQEWGHLANIWIDWLVEMKVHIDCPKRVLFPDFFQDFFCHWSQVNTSGGALPSSSCVRVWIILSDL